MLLKSTMDFFDYQVGDNITMYFDLSYNSTAANQTNPDINPLQQAFHFVSLATGLKMPDQVHHMLGASSDPDIQEFIIPHNFTIASSYEKSVGKFPVAYGNVALIDCHYIFEYLFDYANNTYANQLNETESLIFREWLNYVKSNVTAMNVTMCNYGFEIDGVLKNQVNYYMKSYPLIV